MVCTTCVLRALENILKFLHVHNTELNFSANICEKMVVILQLLFLVLLLNGEGLCQCYNGLSCSGAVVPAADQRDCCVLRSGLSFSDVGTCRPCIG